VAILVDTGALELLRRESATAHKLAIRFYSRNRPALSVKVALNEFQRSAGERRTTNEERRTKNFFNAPPALPFPLSTFSPALPKSDNTRD
jgi:hypothetical protein